MICIQKGVMRLCNERQMSSMTKLLGGCNGCKYRIKDEYKKEE